MSTARAADFVCLQSAQALAELRTQVAAWRQQGLSIGLVPTMGYLHAGHAALVDAAAKQCDRVVVSVFVNPTQFGANEDLDDYPRSLAADADLVAAHGANVLFAPDVATMYPFGLPKHVRVLPQQLTDALCGTSRPGHFEGVCTVVTRLFQAAQPDQAFFGEKDYQQLQVIRYLTRDLLMPVAIVPVPIQRAEDGLALSSRNTYLTDEQRSKAPLLQQTMQQVAKQLREGLAAESVLRAAMDALTDAGFRVDYFELRHQDDLTDLTQAPVEQYKQGRLFAAAWLGKPRLIDNVAVNDAVV